MNEKIKQLREEIESRRQQIIALQIEATPEEVKDYSLKDKDGNTVLLSELFGDGDELLVIHNMGKECRYCTMWADGFRGYSEIISDRMPWVLTSPNEPSIMKEFAEKRNWNYPYLSINGTDFAYDLGYENRGEDGRSSYSPGVSALIKKDGKIYRTGKDFFGPGDYYNPVWHFFDLFPKGVNKWVPKYEY